MRGDNNSVCMQSYGLNELKAFILNILLGKKLAFYKIAMFKNKYLFTGYHPNALRWVNGETVLYSCHRILCSNKNEQTIDTHSLNGSQTTMWFHLYNILKMTQL